MIEEGHTAPDFSVPLDDGTTFSNADFGAPATVVYFYPKDDTSGCTKEAIAFSELADDFAALGVKVIGVSPDTIAKHEKFKAKHGLTVALASDEDKAMVEAFGIWVEKSMYGKKYMGVERSTFLIDGAGKVAKAWRKVKVPGHAQAVLEETRALTTGKG